MSERPGDHDYVLTFHGLGDPGRPLASGEEGVWLSLAVLEAILDAVSERANVRITFDDGNASDVELALPALRERGLTAEFFICAGMIGRRGYLTPSQVMTLTREGMGIGSHGMHHQPWPHLTDDELRQELVQARGQLEDIAGTRVTRVACPFGAYDRRVLRKLRHAGYERVYTSDGGPTRPYAWLQPRTTVGRKHNVPDLMRLLSSGPGSAAGLIRCARMALKRWR